MKLEERIKAFSELGQILRDTITGNKNKFSDSLNNLIISQEKTNQWFTPQNVKMALKALGDELTIDNLKTWTDKYPALHEENHAFNVGVIMAGNIPLVGFHDLLTVLITGNKLIAKTSSKDAELIVFLGKILVSINQDFNEYISFTDGFLKNFDVVIATGSDNSSRYFEYYFGKYPHIIRKNRNSIAIITGNETDTQLELLGTDIFSYFGLGCRSVSKIFIPAGYDLHRLIKNLEGFSGIVNHNKYANNYDFNKAVWMVNKEKFLDTGYLLLKKSSDFSSPVSVLYYDYYDSLEGLKSFLNSQINKIQCIVGSNYVPFGMSQFPKLWEYADNVDTIDFLLKKKLPGIL
jgi:hypothetical protein